jgi:hypothetical protein
MTAHPTCGEGLAERSVLQAKLGDLLDALAENLEVHQFALDLNDEKAGEEFDAYVKLAGKQREIAALLRRTAERMAKYSALPMGKHDPHVMADPKLRRAFAKVVRLEQEIIGLLTSAADGDRRMLDSMRQPMLAS